MEDSENTTSPAESEIICGLSGDTGTDMLGLLYPLDGAPYAAVTSNSTIDTNTLLYPLDGMPILGQIQGTPPPTVIVQVSSIETINCNETVIYHDYSPIPNSEVGDVLEQQSFIVYLLIEEKINAREVNYINGGQATVSRFSIKIPIGVAHTEDYTIKTRLGVVKEEKSSIAIIVGESDLLPVTDLYNVTNPYEPTVFIDGNVLVCSISTNPGTTVVGNTDVYIQWLSTGVGGNDWTDISNFNFVLNDSDGSFSLTSKRPPLVADIDYGKVAIHLDNYWLPLTRYGTHNPTFIDIVAQAHLGKQLNVFGFNGVITDFGAGISDSQAAYICSGIFGNPKGHMQLNLLMGSSAIRKFMGTNQTLTPLGAPVGDAMTLCLSIAHFIGCNLLWGIQNVPLENTFRIDGMTGLDAMGAVAAIAGGVLRWNGNNNYVITYPDQYKGEWIVPSAKLLTAAGCSYSQHYDLGYGLSGAGAVLLPWYVNSGARNTQTPKQEGSLPTIEKLGRIGKRLTSDDPPVIFDLPQDFDKVYIQTLVGTTGSTGGTIPVSINNFMTKDPGDWYELNTSSPSPTAGGPDYIYNAYYGNVYEPQLKIDHQFFQSEGINESIDNNQFTMTLACSKKQLPLPPKASSGASLSLGLNPVKFIKTYSGTFTCQFFGSIPLPGMWGKVVIPDGATVYSYNAQGQIIDTIPVDGGDFTVEGIIEEVNLTYPGQITVSLAQYIRVSFSTPPSNMTIETAGI